MRGNYLTPNGLYFKSDFISQEEETNLISFFSTLEFKPVIIHDNPSKRTIKHFGYKYNAEGEVIEEFPIPPEILWLRDRAALEAKLTPSELNSCLVIYYPPESSIGWHSDARTYGPLVIGISLNASCDMQFQQKRGGIRNVYELKLPPRSYYLMSGESRYFWQHRITPPQEFRYSITFRSLKAS